MFLFIRIIYLKLNFNNLRLPEISNDNFSLNIENVSADDWSSGILVFLTKSPQLNLKKSSPKIKKIYLSIELDQYTLF